MERELEKIDFKDLELSVSFYTKTLEIYIEKLLYQSNVPRIFKSLVKSVFFIQKNRLVKKFKTQIGFNPMINDISNYNEFNFLDLIICSNGNADRIFDQWCNYDNYLATILHKEDQDAVLSIWNIIYFCYSRIGGLRYKNAFKQAHQKGFNTYYSSFKNESTFFQYDFKASILNEIFSSHDNLSEYLDLEGKIKKALKQKRQLETEYNNLLFDIFKTHKEQEDNINIFLLFHREQTIKHFLQVNKIDRECINIGINHFFSFHQYIEMLIVGSHKKSKSDLILYPLEEKIDMEDISHLIQKESLNKELIKLNKLLEDRIKCEEILLLAQGAKDHGELKSYADYDYDIDQIINSSTRNIA